LNDWFANRNTRHKLFVSFGSLILLIVIMLSLGWMTFQGLAERNPTREGGPVRRALDIAAVVSDLDSMQLNVVAASQGLNPDLALSEIANQLGKVTSDLERLQKVYPDSLNPEIGSSFDTLKEAINSSFVPLVKANHMNEARVYASTEQGHFTRLRNLCSQAFENAREHLDKLQKESEDITQQNLTYIGAAGLISLIVAFVLSQVLNRVIADPLQQITTASEKLASGDLNVVLPNPDRKDEVGALIKAFTEVIDSLGGISTAAQKVAQGDLTVQVKPRSENDTLGSAFKLMVENMANATGQIKTAVTILSSAVNNIMASVAESATGATQTATAVTQTTTTVEEVRQTSHVANQKAKNVAESAQKSAQISTMGRKSTEETIQGMKRIREQMDLIADSMVRLSEKSQSIVEIIATVDDLAQQSNLLAVNASIEAAKAGELGRGFAVVAQEVKSMADQSKQATAQVRKILTEIQQATSSAAMATELGSRAVDSAVTQSNQAGEAITVLANSVIESANAAAQIAVSSQQQLAGVDQVATAMLGIKDATAQNLVAIRHVEESAQSLHELGGMLKVILQRYQL